ncbi:Gfo/Idh/MocA family protein [Rhodohalobacter mucosus]|uniref:Oxidoreductase n=1 Tax=Rhodohalobacter mucosus TaxID=2079485 RepID=A0A316TTP4_9BACT|nr:Gfo/Idh/MocA family oxidoreductase [Rhodohalobacter mucosus]PWN06345.1 oxidoreductase [Rhodohalobacter mucosus]
MSNKEKPELSRKSFLKKAGFGAAALMGLPVFTEKSHGNHFLLSRSKRKAEKFSANDQVNLALIGAGGMGQGNTFTALNVDGTRLVAACDLYDSRLNRCREHWGDDLFISRDYREILNRSDVDAVIVATTDHWHERITVAALEAGKPVYLEKPMTQTVEEGHRLIEAERRTGVPLIVGSQRTSSILYEKARDLIDDGEIGELNFVEAYWDRRSAIGAWQYSIPPGANSRNVDWERFRQGLPPMDFNATHFFRWRNYDDYGTGVAGDLFVHLFSGLHLITGSVGPNRVMGTGGLRYWEDGRDAEDMVLGLFDYPETEKHPAFNLALRVNFADGSGGGSSIKLVGSDGVIEIGWNTVTLRKWREPDAPGMSIGDFDASTREEFQEYYAERYPETRAKIIEPNEFVYRAPDGYNDRYDHFVNWMSAIRDGASVVQDSTFGLRAAGPALLTSVSLREKRSIDWDPTAMRAG